MAFAHYPLVHLLSYNESSSVVRIKLKARDHIAESDNSATFSIKLKTHEQFFMFRIDNSAAFSIVE